MKSIETRSEMETIALGGEIAKQLAPGDVVTLTGDLGTGKTRLIKGICQALGVMEHVASPTFTIVNEYRVNELMIYHFDFYRVKSLAEIIDLGFEEYVSGDGICLIEWPEKAREILPLQRFSITLGFGKDESARKIDIRENIEVEA